MFFSIFIILITLLYLIVLELSKNIMIGWIVGIIAGVLMRSERNMLKKQNLLTRRSKWMMWIAYIIVLALNLLMTKPPVKNIPAVDTKNPQVTEVMEINQGFLRGVYNEDKSVRVYAGIPYAAAPIGNLRFKEPQAPEKWDGVKTFDTFGPMAMQKRTSTFMDSLSHILGWHDYQVKSGDEFIEAMSEDCLYLNVWTPESKDDELKPVIFYIHGGSLNTGQSSYTEYRGEDLAKQGVVFVDFAYRLGVFGYYAAAIGTGLSFLVGSVLIMNIYYFKKFKYNMFLVYLQIFDRTWICILISGLGTYVFSRYINISWIGFIAEVGLFCILYFGLLLLYGLNNNEKRQIFAIIRRIRKNG